MRITKNKIPALVFLILCFVACIISYCFINSTPAYAATVAGGSKHEAVLSDNKYEFTEGAEIITSDMLPKNLEFQKTCNCIDDCDCYKKSAFPLKFDFNALDEKYLSYKRLARYYKNAWGRTVYGYLEWSFTLYSLSDVGSENENSKLLYKYSIRMENDDGNGNYFNVFYFKHDYNTLNLYLRDDSLNVLNEYVSSNMSGVSTTNQTPRWDYSGLYKIKGFKISKDYADMFGNLINNVYLLGMLTNSYFENYYIDCDIKYNMLLVSNIFKDWYGENPIYVSKLSSSTVNCAKMLNDKKDSDWYLGLSDDYKLLFNNIIDLNFKRTIYVDYLDEIPNTPFAVKKRLKGEVYLLEDELLSFGQLYDLLGVNSLKVFNSFEKDLIQTSAGDNYYEVTYYQDIRIRTVDTSGLVQDIMLDINQSFYEFYSSFNVNGESVISEEQMEYSFNNLLNKYVDVENFEDERLDSSEYVGFNRWNYIYGYWGMIVIPRENTLNEIWSQLFSTKTTTNGFVDGYIYDTTISLDTYNYLLKDRGFNFLSRFGQIAASLLSGEQAQCRCYMFYGESGANGLIAENGSENDDVNQKGSIFGSFSGFVQNLSNKNPFALILGVVGIVGIIFIAIKFLPLVKTKKSISNSNVKRKKDGKK